MASKAFLVAGLGNPGPEYCGTPHNAGFEVVEKLAAEAGAGLRRSRRFPARVAGATLEGGEVWLMQPLTYMNRSGEAVGPWLRYYRLPPGRMLVIVDDIDLPLGTMRFRGRGGSGGHKGLRSIIEQIGSDDFTRLRIGVGRGSEAADVVRHVLTPFSVREGVVFKRIVEVAVEAVHCLIKDGLEPAMNRYNGLMLAGDSISGEQSLNPATPARRGTGSAG